MERLTAGSRQQHTRNDSGTTGVASSNEYPDGHAHNNGRRHDYDVQAMESDLSPRPGAIRNPIPPPVVTVRSEFPTLTRSRQQQPLTCLVTVEVPEGRWRPDMDDLRFTAPNTGAALHSEEIYSPARSPVAPVRPPPQPLEPTEDLDRVAEDLRARVDSWHGLEFQRYEHRFSSSSPQPKRSDLEMTDALPLDLASYGFGGYSGSAKIANRGKSWNAIFSQKC